jgi:hypothetical protein
MTGRINERRVRSRGLQGAPLFHGERLLFPGEDWWSQIVEREGRWVLPVTCTTTIIFPSDDD